ncbi:cysteine desulfurase family protein [Catenulispora subtropica]|uniref:Cysteine desulfurase family protein n=1 Tax=Catenulispora subtropica TaxID=450798 RepID=A0ABP5EI26_9ACTN
MAVYLDHAATTPMLPAAVDAMTARLAVTGNANSLHAAGRAARRVVEESREQIAEALGARPSEVVFTSGGTESDNLAVKGLYWARRDADPRRRRVLAAKIEHHAVLDPLTWLGEHEGAEIEWLPVDRAGRVDPEVLRAAIERNPGTVALTTVMWANNEVGTVQPIHALASVSHEYGIPMHSDAVQAVGALDVDWASSGLAAMTFTGHKVGGPIGVGALLLGRKTQAVPVLHGGGQERDVRSGTLDTPAVAGFAAAVVESVKNREAKAELLTELRDDLVARVRLAVPDVIVNGDRGPGTGLPGIANMAFPGCEGDSLLMLLDARGIECSTGSACSAGVAQPSHVLLAMGLSGELARGSLRFSLGHTSTKADVDALAEAIGPVVARARAAGLS